MHYLNASGWEVNLAAPAGATTPAQGAIVTAEYDEHGNTIRTLDATNRLLALHAAPGWEEMLVASGLTDGDPEQLAQELDSRSYYSEDGLDLLVTRGPAQQLAMGNDPDAIQVLHPVTRTTYDEGKPDGLTYHLATTVVSGGLALGDDPADGVLVDVVTTANRYTPIDGSSALGAKSGWIHKNPTQVTVSDGDGSTVTSSVAYDDQGRPIKSHGPGVTGTEAGTVMTLFYTAGTNPDDAACSNKPQWAGQPCVTKAAGAVTRHDASVSATELPVKRVTGYNRWGSPTVVTDSATGPVAGTDVTLKRTTTTTYDTADRVTAVSITGTGTGVGVAVATTTTAYDASGEVAEVQSVNASGQVTSRVSKQYDLLGRLTSYTDATGATTRSTYDRWGNLTQTAQDIAGTTSTVDYTYDRSIEPRGYLTSMTDSVAGTISATWGFDGQLEKQALPGGITLTIGYDAARVPVSRVYTRDSDGAEIWRDSVVENHRGQWISHESTTGTATYGYDRLGRLTTATDTPAGADAVCTSRSYTYDVRTNRTARSEVVAAGSDDGCLSTTDPSATTTGYTYDSADRLMSTTDDPGAKAWVYDPFGRTTSMPTSDGASVRTTYTVNDLVASQEIAGESRYAWNLDPLHRRSTNVQSVWLNGAWQESATVVSHYADDSDSPSWITEDITNPTDVTRYVNDVQGAMTITTSTTGDRQLQLVDLHGDVVGTLPIADAAAEATWSGLAYSRTDEFGAPAPLTGAGATTGPPARYGWLGAEQRSSEALGGVILMGVRQYSTVTGRFLSIDSIAGGSATAYDYCNADPVNCTDLAGTFSLGSVLSAVAVVGEVASLIPGPVGAVAAGVSAVAYAAQGNTAKAVEMGITAAAALVGAGGVVKVASRAVSIARSSGQAISRAAPRLFRAAKAAAPTMRSACGPNSFAAETPIVMADGSLKSVEDVELGDAVQSYDFIAGVTEVEQVVGVVARHSAHSWVTLTIETGARVSTVKSTSEHPFWVAQEVGGEWVDAERVRIGDALIDPQGGRAIVRAVETEEGFDWAFNFTVSSNHNYFAGEISVLTHNEMFCPAKALSPVWRAMTKNPGLSSKNGRDVKTVGTGRKKTHYSWDEKHGDIEVFDRQGRHLGSMHPYTGEMHKPPVAGPTHGLKVK